MDEIAAGKRYYIISPAGVESGGPELTHQLCRELTDMQVSAKMYYIYSSQVEPVDVPAMPRYLKYGTEHVTDMAEADALGSVVIFNESTTRYMKAFDKAMKVLWWMSVDNYQKDGDKLSGGEIVRQVSFHLVQSFYAYDFIRNTLGVPEEQILLLADYIGENFGKVRFPEEYRQDIILYNPKKGYERLKPLIEKTPELKWIPLVNLNEAQLLKIMQFAKIYIDLGNHPGRDRIPREAAASGCCVVTNREGSAAFFEDVPIPDLYKFDNCEERYDEIKALLLDICTRFGKHSRNFDGYRGWIAGERQRFAEDTGEMVAVLEQARRG